MEIGITEIAFDRRKIIFEGESSLNLLRIRALCRAYGFGRSFIKYYLGNSGIVCIYDNLAICHFYCEPDNTMLGFLSLSAKSVLTEIPIELTDYTKKSGSVYRRMAKVKEVGGIEVKNDINSAFCVLSKVFKEDINQMNYNHWYADMSHCIRHGMSEVYTISGKCSATKYFFDDGILMLSQLGTVLEFRGQGLASRLIDYISYKNSACNLAVLSQSRESDAFYERIGFEKIGEWYIYEK